MLVKMKRSQATALGLLRAGVTYNIDETENKKLMDHLLKNKLAEKTTSKQLKKDADLIAARQASELADTSGDGPATALREAANAELKAQVIQSEKDQMKAESDANEAKGALGEVTAELIASRETEKLAVAELANAKKAAKKSRDALDLKTTELTEARKSLDAANATVKLLTTELETARSSAVETKGIDAK